MNTTRYSAVQDYVLGQPVETDGQAWTASEYATLDRTEQYEPDGGDAPCQIRCNMCSIETNHRLLSSYQRLKPGPHQAVDTTVDFELYACSGCDATVLRETHTAIQQDTLPPIVMFHPGRLNRPWPKWADRLADRGLEKRLFEVYRAMERQLNRLALMGCRGLLDAYTTSLTPDAGSFSAQIKILLKDGRLTASQAETLRVAFDAGSAAMHRDYTPTEEQLSHVLDVVEHVLQSTLMSDIVEGIRKTTPPRPGKP